MNTSYFHYYNLPNGISISVSDPCWFDGDSYPELKPTYNILLRYKKDHDKILYTETYKKEILQYLDPILIWNDLKNKTLLCWEKPDMFCHRRIVAEWLEKELKVSIPEYQKFLL